MKEFVDFLGGQAPYDALESEDLERLAACIEVEYVRAGDVIVQDGAGVIDRLFVVRTGAVEVLDRGRVVDLLGPGDTFGHVSLLSGLEPALSVRAAEDTLIYRLPDPRGVLEHPERLRFAHFGTQVARQRLTRPGVIDAGALSVSKLARPVVLCDPDTTIEEAARRISEARQSCAVVVARRVVGVVTDSDFRLAFSQGSVAPDDPVIKIASLPALSAPHDTTVATAFLLMVERGVHHLVLTDSSRRPVGVVRVVDMASSEVRDPLLVREAVRSASSLAELADACRMIPQTAVELFDNAVPATHIAGLLAAVTEAVLGRLLKFRGADMDRAGQVSFLVLGSLARKEPLPLSDVDTGLVWADSNSQFNSANHTRAAAERLLQDMEKCGLRRCPDGANASNPLFSRSVSAWTAATPSWIKDPTGDGALLLTSMVADCRPIANIALGRRVVESLLRTARSTEFLASMLRFTLAIRPPTGFVRNFVVDSSGEHKGQLDLKRGGLIPIASLGRWAAVVAGDARGTTPDRLRRGAQLGLFTTDEAETLIGAFEEVYSLLLEREVAMIREGRALTHYVDPKTLDTLTRRYLRDAFRAVSEVQSRLQSEWMARLP